MSSLRSALIAALLCCGFLTSCTRTPAPQTQQPPNVILYLIDTLRADHLSGYGYHRETSPVIDQLAAEGVQFDVTYAQDSRTLGSIPSLLTSLYAISHGVGQYGSRVNAKVPTLAESFRDGGYQTGTFITNINAGVFTGLDRGFDHYHDAIRGWEDGAALRTLPDAAFFSWLDSREDAPFFAYIHTAEPHRPYTPPAPYDTMFTPDYKGKITGFFNGENGYKQATSPEDLAHVVGLYDGEIRFADSSVGQLLRGLEDRGLRENTIIVITSDHGEELFDRGGWNHGHSTYEELVRVPLVISGGSTTVPEGRRVAEAVQSIDIAPTLLELVGLPVPTRFEGESLIPLMAGTKNQHFQERKVYTASTKKPRKRALVRNNWKLIRGGSSLELYELKKDPAEATNRFWEEKETQEQLRSTLNEWERNKKSSAVLPSSEELSPEETERLKVLGYL